MPSPVPLPTPVVGLPVTARPGEPLVTAAGDRIWLMEVGLACCAVEVAAALTGRVPSVSFAGADAGQRGADVLLVSGTVTDATALAVRRLYDRLAGPAYVVSFGACSNTGGPYWDSYCVTKGVDQVVPVDVYIPGCPPRPEALLDGLRALSDAVSGRVAP